MNSNQLVIFALMVLLQMCLSSPLNKSDQSDDDGVQIEDESDFFLEENYLPFRDNVEFYANFDEEQERKSHNPRSKRSTDDIVKSYVDNLKAVLFQFVLFILH